MTQAAKALGLERSHLYKKCQQLGIDLKSLHERHGLAAKLITEPYKQILRPAARAFSGWHMVSGITDSAGRAQARLPRRSWQIACLLSLGVLVNYFDRVNLSVSHEALIAAFGISNVTFGYLSGAYNWTYAMCQLPIGVLLDRFGVKRIGRISTFVWSVASFSAAVAPGIPSLFGARFLLGIGEAPTFPANAKAVGL